MSKIEENFIIDMIETVDFMEMSRCEDIDIMVAQIKIISNWADKVVSEGGRNSMVRTLRSILDDPRIEGWSDIRRNTLKVSIDIYSKDEAD